MLTPYMPQHEIAMMDMVFALKRPARVLEFGAGGSTVRWGNCISVLGWRSIEHDPDWFDRVSAELAFGNSSIVMVSGEEPAHYISGVMPGARFDLIFVDGLYRVECIQASPQWLAPGGVVVLHDASRLEYAEAWDVYSHKQMLTKGDSARNGIMLMWGDV